MKVKDRINKLKEDNFKVINEFYPEGIIMNQNEDCIKICEVKRYNFNINEVINNYYSTTSIDLKYIDDLPNKILDIDYDEEKIHVGVIGLSLELIIIID